MPPFLQISTAPSPAFPPERILHSLVPLCLVVVLGRHRRREAEHGQPRGMEYLLAT